MIYLDTSAIAKLVRPEPESGDLVGWLNARSGRPVVTSKLAEVELAVRCGGTSRPGWPRCPPCWPG